MACPSPELADLIVAQMHERDAFAATLKASRTAVNAAPAAPQHSTESHGDLRQRKRHLSVRVVMHVWRAIERFPSFPK